MRAEKPNCKECISYAVCRSIITGSIETNTIRSISSILLSVRELEDKCRYLYIHTSDIAHQCGTKYQYFKSEEDYTRFVTFENRKYSSYTICKTICILALLDISTDWIPKELRDKYHLCLTNCNCKRLKYEKKSKNPPM